VTVYRCAVSYVHRKNLGRARLVRAVSVVARTLEGDDFDEPSRALNIKALRPPRPLREANGMHRPRS
jgi:hypothetical protein